LNYASISAGSRPRFLHDFLRIFRIDYGMSLAQILEALPASKTTARIRPLRFR
jgi:hypothetical protein